MVKILLQNGAEVNAVSKVISDEWTDVIHRNACQVGRNEVQSVEMALEMADCIELIVYG